MARREFTAVYQKRPRGYIAWIEEVPGANTQGRTKREVKENLREALALLLEANRQLSLRRSRKTSRESIHVTVPA